MWLDNIVCFLYSKTKTSSLICFICGLVYKIYKVHICTHVFVPSGQRAQDIYEISMRAHFVWL